MSTDTLEDDYNGDNATQLYDYYDITTNDSDLVNISATSAVEIDLLNLDSSSPVTPSSVTETPREKRDLSWAFYPTMPYITAEENSDQRIVGGDEAIPGEIPWQVLWCGMQGGEMGMS